MSPLINKISVAVCSKINLLITGTELSAATSKKHCTLIIKASGEELTCVFYSFIIFLKPLMYVSLFVIDFYVLRLVSVATGTIV